MRETIYVPTYLLVSDLDDTLLGDSGALARFSEFLPAAPACIDIVYASGRFFESVRRDVDTTPLPEPVAVIGGVGSEIRSFPAGELDRKWIERLSGSWSAATARDVLAQAEEAALELQPQERQSRFKVSYFLPAATAAQLERLRAKLVARAASGWRARRDRALADIRETRNQRLRRAMSQATNRSAGGNGYRQAVVLMKACSTEHGFLATPTKQDNYRRVWSRDGAIIGWQRC